MNYLQTIDYLFNQLPVFQVIGAGAYKPGLKTAYILAEAFGNPHHSFKSIHVAGTNGKGSTTHMLASVLMEAGYKVGQYTSPHIFDFRERIRVNGEKISKDAVTDFVTRYQAMGLDCQPSFFELTTIMAFDYFRSQGVDFAVIETGLGGRLDTTNIITPLISVITNVSLDHVAQLGDTVELIAKEKAGIIKPNVPVVVGEAKGSVRKVFSDTATAQNAQIIFAEDNNLFYDNAGKPHYECPLTGDFQAKNINTVLNALAVLNICDYSTINKGLAHVLDNTHLIGRWMQLEIQGHKVVIDTGHNIGAWEYLAPMLHSLADSADLWVVMGFSNDKDIVPIFDRLPLNAHYCFVTPSVKRGRDSVSLSQMAKDRGLSALAFDTVSHGFNYALRHCPSAGTVFVGGSNYVVADLPISL